jgi:hypothetical protein
MQIISVCLFTADLTTFPVAQSRILLAYEGRSENKFTRRVIP